MSDLETISDRIGLPNHMKILRLNPDNMKDVIDSYTVLVNPQSYKVVHHAPHTENQPLGGGNTVFSFNKVATEKMSLNLLFDSTGSLGQIPFINNENVLVQINRFLEVAFSDVSKDDKFKELQLVWGPMEFFGVLEKVEISYSHFSATGIPIRAKAVCSFSGGKIRFDESKLPKPKKRKKKLDYAKQKHAINAVLKYGSYMTIVSSQPETALPKSIRLPSEIIKMLI